MSFNTKISFCVYCSVKNSITLTLNISEEMFTVSLHFLIIQYLAILDKSQPDSTLKLSCLLTPFQKYCIIFVYLSC